MIETPRLVLRAWREGDREPWAEMNADPDVRRHFPGVLTRAQADAEIDRMTALLDTHGVTFWALERRCDHALLGMTGVIPTGPALPFGGAPEVGWRLARSAWGQGYASEAACAALAFAFEHLKPPEIVSFTATTNLPSQAVMRRIGMTRAAERDFDHPALPEEHELRRHVVFALSRREREGPTRSVGG